MKIKSVKPLAPESRIHFMGIGGSGLSAVAVMSQKHGFRVDGCDLEKSTPYLTKVEKAGIKVYKNHDEKHLANADLLVVSPAVVYQNRNHPEYKIAEKKNIVKTWDEFIGENLLENKKVICIAGTHGKSTTTAIAGLIFEAAGVDPNILIGATVKEWNSNYRVGKSDLFIIEADEFYDKFLNYKPQVIIINNIEFDHPDYFKNEEDIIKSFNKFVSQLHKDMILIINLDSEGVIKLFKSMDNSLINSIRIYGYTLQQKSKMDLKNVLFANITGKLTDYTTFTAYSQSLGLNENYQIKIPGSHNVSNCLGIIILAKLFNIDTQVLKNVFTKFEGIGRRLEKIGETKGVAVYDDYAHHPTAVKATLAAIKQKFPAKHLIVVLEPHSYSRTKALLGDYKEAFEGADVVVIEPIFKSRDTKTFGVTNKSVVAISSHKNITAANSAAEIIKLVKKALTGDDIILVMGAGYSYLWSRDILKSV